MDTVEVVAQTLSVVAAPVPVDTVDTVFSGYDNWPHVGMLSEKLAETDADDDQVDSYFSGRDLQGDKAGGRLEGSCGGRPKNGPQRISIKGYGARRR